MLKKSGQFLTRVNHDGWSRYMNRPFSRYYILSWTELIIIKWNWLLKGYCFCAYKLLNTVFILKYGWKNLIIKFNGKTEHLRFFCVIWIWSFGIMVSVQPILRYIHVNINNLKLKMNGVWVCYTTKKIEPRLISLFLKVDRSNLF